jgi:hypothetical protein
MMNLTTPIDSTANSHTISNFINLRNNRSLIITNGTKNDTSNITTLTETFPPTNQQSTIIKSN